MKWAYQYEVKEPNPPSEKEHLLELEEEEEGHNKFL